MITLRHVTLCPHDTAGLAPALLSFSSIYFHQQTNIKLAITSQPQGIVSIVSIVEYSHPIYKLFQIFHYGWLAHVHQ
jgi:hypothetical protein